MAVQNSITRFKEPTASGFVQVSETPNVQIYYCVDGPLDGKRPILLFSNSLAASTHLWDESIDSLGAEYTIIRYDARFHGKSPPSSDASFDYSIGHSIEDLADDVLKILDHLKVAKIHALIGLSIGAAVGLIFGAKHPERVDRVIVIGTRATSNPESNANHAARIKYGRENGSLALGRQSIARWFEPEFFATYPERIAHAEEVYCKQSIDGYEASICALRVMDLFPWAEDVGKRGDGARFVFVAGELDGTVPSESKELADRAGGSEVIIVPGSGHITNIQLPNEFHSLLKRVL